MKHVADWIKSHRKGLLLVVFVLVIAAACFVKYKMQQTAVDDMPYRF